MAGKFLKRGAIVDTIKSEHRINAIRKRRGLTGHPVRVTSCGCPDPNCGAFHVIETDRTVPTSEECAALLAEDNRVRKPARVRRDPGPA
jgi:hypothetical protein